MLVKIEARILIFPGTDFHFPSTSVPPGTFLGSERLGHGSDLQGRMDATPARTHLLRGARLDVGGDGALSALDHELHEAVGKPFEHRLVAATSHQPIDHRHAYTTTRSAARITYISRIDMQIAD